MAEPEVRRVLIVYHSRDGGTRKLARQVARGVACVAETEAVVREVLDGSDASASAPSPTVDELRECDALVLGSPTRFGVMSAPLKAFLDQTSSIWMSGALVGKPGAAFTSTASLHGGQEMTLLSLLVPMLHHGMVIAGVPYTEPELMTTAGGGAPYGASHWSGPDGPRELASSEKKLARALGARIAQLAHQLSSA